jgi:hypothetical protein
MMPDMDNEPRPRLGDGRFLVPTVLGVLGLLFALSALPFEPSPSKLVLNIIALVMLAAAGAGLAVALEGARRRKAPELPE